MKKFNIILSLIFLLLFINVKVFATETLQVTAILPSFLSIVVNAGDEFSILDAQGDLIPYKDYGEIVVKSNNPNWKIIVDSYYGSTSDFGRLKHDLIDQYIPYSFEIRDEENVILSKFNIESILQPKTPVVGKSFFLRIYFTDDDTTWQQGTYSDTLVFTVTTD